MSEIPEDIMAPTADACVDAVIERVGKRIVLGLPLGLGKPVRLANALYERACNDPTLDLHIVTAISCWHRRAAQLWSRGFSVLSWQGSMAKCRNCATLEMLWSAGCRQM